MDQFKLKKEPDDMKKYIEEDSKVQRELKKKMQNVLDFEKKKTKEFLELNSDMSGLLKDFGHSGYVELSREMLSIMSSEELVLNQVRMEIDSSSIDLINTLNNSEINSAVIMKKIKVVKAAKEDQIKAEKKFKSQNGKHEQVDAKSKLGEAQQQYDDQIQELLTDFKEKYEIKRIVDLQKFIGRNLTNSFLISAEQLKQLSKVTEKASLLNIEDSAKSEWGKYFEESK